MAKRPTALARRLKTAREAKGLSTRDTDTAAGLSPGYVWRIETGHRPHVAADTAAALARALDVTLDWLINGEGDGPARPAPVEKAG